MITRCQKNLPGLIMIYYDKIWQWFRIIGIVGSPWFPQKFVWFISPKRFILAGRFVSHWCNSCCRSWPAAIRQGSSGAPKVYLVHGAVLNLTDAVLEQTWRKDQVWMGTSWVAVQPSRPLQPIWSPAGIFHHLPTISYWGFIWYMVPWYIVW